MTIEEFAAVVTGEDGLFAGNDELREQLTFKIMEKPLINGGHLTGVSICSKDNNIAPAIYLDDAYECYENAEDKDEALRVILEKLENLYLEGLRRTPDVDVNKIMEFEWVKGRVSAKLVNTEKNAELLLDKPHVNLGDLSAVFMVEIGSTGEDYASIPVTEELAKTWNTTAEELMKLAADNITKKARVKSMYETMVEIFERRDDDDIPADMDLMLKSMEEDSTMLVATNDSKLHGANVLLSGVFMKQVAEKYGSFWIIPSSVHELLFIPDNGEAKYEDLLYMVREVNSTQVAPTDRLADNVYFYSKEEAAVQYGETKETIVSY